MLVVRSASLSGARHEQQEKAHILYVWYQNKIEADLSTEHHLLVSWMRRQGKLLDGEAQKM